MHHPHCLSHFLSPQVLPTPGSQVPLPPILLQVCSVASPRLQTVSECLHNSMEESAEPAPEFAGSGLQSGQFLQFLGEVAAGECVEEGIGVRVDGCFEDLFDFDERQAVPLVPRDIVQ